MAPATIPSTASSSTDAGDAGEIMLFGVRVMVDSMRKSVSMSNLSQYEYPPASNNNNNNNNNNNGNKADDNLTAGYASADDAVPHSTGNRERKRGVPWTEEEHKLFLLGLQKVGKGDWRGISRNFVKTRTPTQVASHAQKYFLRRTNLNRRRRRSSLFDITTESVAVIPMEEEQVNLNQQEKTISQVSAGSNGFGMTQAAFPMNAVALPIDNPVENVTLAMQQQQQQQQQGTQLNVNSINATSANLIRPVPIFPAAADLNLNLNSNSSMDPSPLSLKLSLQSGSASSSPSSSRHSAFQVMPSFSNGDSSSMISVA